MGLLVILTPLASVKGYPFWRQIRLRRPPTLITIYLAMAIGLAFTLALLPPTSWDTLSYHLKGPQLYLKAGRIYPEIDVFSLNNPFLMQMFFALAMAVRNDIVAQLIHFAFLFYLIGIVLVVSKQALKLPTGRHAILLLLATPMVLLLAPWAYNDLALASMTLVSLYSIIQWQQDENKRWLLWSGVFSGLAISLKYTSFLLPIVIGLVIVWRLWRQPKLLWWALLWFGMPAFIISCAWYFKSWVFMGNPVYPFVFGGRYWDELRSLAHSEPGSGIGWQLSAMLRIPVTLTQGVQDSSGDGPVGPFYLAFLPLLFWAGFKQLRGKSAPGLTVLLVYALAHIALWTLGVINSANLWQGRLLLPAFVALIPVMAWVWHDLRRFDHPQFSLRRFLKLVLAFVLIFSLVGQIVAWIPHQALGTFAGNNSREAYLENQLGILSVASHRLNELLPEDAIVQFLWEPRTYYCHVECRGDHILDKYPYLENKFGSPEGVATRLREEGVTHVLIFHGGLNFLRENANSPATLPADFVAFEQFIKEDLVPIQQWDNTYTLYALQPN
jgi:4-amino-4-deoxy-L-arabinose transferase-like glycosyltransferase